MAWSCFDCKHLNKQKCATRELKDCYNAGVLTLYGCKKSKDGFVIGEVRRESELKQMGGGCFEDKEEIVQISFIQEE